MIKENVQKLLEEIPKNVLLVVAAKTRSLEEVNEAIDAGIKIVGENYLQEAEKIIPYVENTVQWHYIGRLQRKKVKKIVRIFDMIETVDSVEIAKEINERAAQIKKIMSVLVEVNSGREKQKGGVYPEQAESLIREIARFENIYVQGLMTMGPLLDNSEKLRPYFKLTKKLFDQIKALKIKNVKMLYLSMGMSDSYKVAIQEGANIVRIGTLIFGPRSYKK